MYFGNNKIIRARSTEEYVDMIRQAIDETFDLLQAVEFDEEFMAEARPLIDELFASPSSLLQPGVAVPEARQQDTGG